MATEAREQAKLENRLAAMEAKLRDAQSKNEEEEGALVANALVDLTKRQRGPQEREREVTKRERGAQEEGERPRAGEGHPGRRLGRFSSGIALRGTA